MGPLWTICFACGSHEKMACINLFSAYILQLSIITQMSTKSQNLIAVSSGRVVQWCNILSGLSHWGYHPFQCCIATLDRGEYLYIYTRVKKLLGLREGGIKADIAYCMSGHLQFPPSFPSRTLQLFPADK